MLMLALAFKFRVRLHHRENLRCDNRRHKNIQLAVHHCYEPKLKTMLLILNIVSNLFCIIFMGQAGYCCNFYEANKALAFSYFDKKKTENIPSGQKHKKNLPE